MTEQTPSTETLLSLRIHVYPESLLLSDHPLFILRHASVLLIEHRADLLIFAIQITVHSHSGEACIPVGHSHLMPDVSMLELP